MEDQISNADTDSIADEATDVKGRYLDVIF